MAMLPAFQFLLILVLLLVFCFTTTTAQTNSFPIFRCQDNFTSAAYQTNIETALAIVSSVNAIRYGFNKTSVGEGRNTVTAVALCRGDVGSESCNDCINNSVVLLRQNCAYMTDALIWNSNCSLLYSNRTRYGSTFNNRPYGKLLSYVNASNLASYNVALRDLAARLRTEAANGNSLRKFATGDTTVVLGPDSSSKIYGLMQCSQELSSFDCNSCLSVVFKEAQGCCNGDIDVAVFYASCQVRYSNVLFYNDPPAISLVPAAMSPSSRSSPTTPGGKRNSSKTILYVIVPVAGTSVGILSIGLYFLVMKARRKNNVTGNAKLESAEMLMGTVGSLQFDLPTIEAATKNFYIENKIGEGGFGPVYKGVLANGTELAVKRLSKSSVQGSHEFVNEVVLMAKLQHRNLVRLLGFCLEGDEKLLVYEYISNKSLDYFLFDPNRHGLNWPKRYKIIEGITRGILYLHQDSRLRIIHRDLKASNILIDLDMSAKISDFGLARIVGADQTQVNTNRIVGTYGYMSPEYAVHGHFSVKSDVFAFGVIVLEIITGRKSSSFFYQDDQEDLPHFVWKNWMNGSAMELIDPTLMLETTACFKDEVMRCINIGLLCVQEEVDARPSMASVLNMLNNYSITLPSPKRPPHYLFKRPDASYFSTIKTIIRRSKSKQQESLITEVHPR